MNYKNILVAIIFLAGLITLIIGITYQHQPAIISGVVLTILDSIGLLINVFPQPIKRLPKTIEPPQMLKPQLLKPPQMLEEV